MPDWVIDGLRNLGVFGGPFLLFFWYRETQRADRLAKEVTALNKALLDRAESYLNATNSQSNALAEVTRTVAGAQSTIKDMMTLLHEVTAMSRAVVKRGGAK